MSMDADDRLKELDHIIRGIDGKNGLRSRVMTLEEKLEHYHTTLSKKQQEIQDRFLEKLERINKTLYMFIGGLLILNIILSLFKDKIFL